MSTRARTERCQITMSPTHCASLVARLAMKSPPDPSQTLFRRETYRWALQAPAAVRYHTIDGCRATIDASVADLSAAGIGLHSQESLPTDLVAEVFVAAENKTYSAAIQVMHCTPTKDGFSIGCEFVVQEEQR